jgi:hypothetical protein
LSPGKVRAVYWKYGLVELELVGFRRGAAQYDNTTKSLVSQQVSHTNLTSIYVSIGE